MDYYYKYIKYKTKYIKYKTKYLKIKNNQIGGNKYIEELKEKLKEKEKYKIDEIIEIAAGWNGVAYKIKKDGK